MDTIAFLGIKIHAVTKREIVGILADFAQGDGTKVVFYLNAHCVNVAFADAQYRALLNRADLVYTGGQGVVWASRFLGSPLPERVNILDFFDQLSSLLIAKGRTIYLLGGEEAVVGRTAQLLRQRGLSIVGYRNGFFGPEDEPAVIEEINRLKPDILIVGMGVPRQEKWIFRHLGGLQVHLCWGVGAAFTWLSGERARAPRWMMRCGLEWLHRFLQEPRRLGKRYCLGNLLFVYRVAVGKRGKACGP